ncbi:MAG: OmpA family protein [Thiolinea sp.]
MFLLPDGREVEIAGQGFESELKQALQNDRSLSLIFDNVEFETGSSRLNARSRTQIEATAALLNTYPERQVLIRGHTDNTGDINTNSLLSLMRSDSMKNALVELGIDSKRIKIEGVGPLEPVADNNSAEGRRQNRRLELVIAE